MIPRYIEKFHQRFRLAGIAAKRRGYTFVKQDSVGTALYPENPRSGTTMVSDWIKGKRDFPSNKLKPFLDAIDPGRQLLSKLSDDNWFLPLRDFAKAMVRVALIVEDDCRHIDAPLAGRLAKLKNAAELLELLKEYQTTHNTMNIFQANIRRLSTPELGRLEGLLHDLIEPAWAVRDGRGYVTRALEIHSRMAKCGLTTGKLLLPTYRSFEDIPAWVAPRYHIGAFINGVHGDLYAIGGAISQLISNPIWQSPDCEGHIEYYGGLAPMLEATKKNIETRRPEVCMTDSGRALLGFTQAIKDPDLIALAFEVREVTLEASKSLKLLGLARLRSVVEKTMPAIQVWRRKK